MSTRDDITERLLAGETPYNLFKENPSKYPRASVYRIYNDLKGNGQLFGTKSQTDEQPEDDGGGTNHFSPPSIKVPSRTSTTTRAAAAKVSALSDRTGVIKHVIPETQLASLLSGETALAIDPLNAVRGILGMKMRPKVLECPAPDLLYPAMIIAEQEWGWQPMQPQDFIDTVLSKFLESADIELNIYGRRSQMEEIMRYAEKGGYRSSGNGNGHIEPDGDNIETCETKEESQDDGDTGSARPSGEESGLDAEPGSGGKDEVGSDTIGPGGCGGEPVQHSPDETTDGPSGGRSQETAWGTAIEGE